MNFNLALEVQNVCLFFADITKFSISLESPIFPTFLAKCRECEVKFEERDSHRKLRNSHGKVIEKLSASLLEP